MIFERHEEPGGRTHVLVDEEGMAELRKLIAPGPTTQPMGRAFLYGIDVFKNDCPCGTIIDHAIAMDGSGPATVPGRSEAPRTDGAESPQA